MSDQTTEQQWIRGRLDRIDENLVKVLVGQTAISNKVQSLEDRVADLEEGQESLERKVDNALFPGKALRWAAAAITVLVGIIGGLKAIGLRIAFDSDTPAAESRPDQQPTKKESIHDR